MRTKILLAIGSLLCAAGLAKAQTRDYVQTDVVKVSGIKTDSALFVLGVNGRQTSRVYLDGLGRTAQSIAIKGSPNQKDLVQPVVYDSLGRNSKAYLPYTGADGLGGFHPTALTEQHSFYNGGMNSTIARDTSPYSRQLFENSPLQRVYEVGSIGTGFQPVSGQHFKTADYRTNTAADSVVVWLPSGSSSGYYSAGKLMVTYGKDEQNNQAYTFSNDLGQLVLKRQQGPSGTWLNTYYIYNDAGQVTCIVPPKASALMKAANSYSLSVTGVDKLLFKMTYDYRGRMTVKKVPSAGEMYVVYDPLSRPVLMQDANLRASNKWNYIKYDVKGRAISQGIYTDATHTSLSSMQSYVSGLTYTYYYEDRSTSSTYQYYTNNSFPTSDTEPLAYSYYDDYHITHTNTPDYAYAPQGLSGEASADTLVNGMLTAVRKRTVGSGISATWLMNVVFYDSFGRTIQSQSNNQLHTSGTPDKSTIVMDFTGKPMLTKTVKISSGSDSIRVQTAYTYDHADRVTAIDQSYNGGINKRIAAYAYNELGQLIKKNLGRLNSGTSYPYDVTLRSTVIATTNTIAQNSIKLDSGFHATAGSSLSYTARIKTDYLQALDYRYNIRGQLISMNNATLAADTANNADVNDVFGMELLYDKADGGLGNTAYYNGRLSAIKWMTRSGTAYGTQSAQKAYNYSYDELNRLTDAGYYEKAAGGSWVNNKAYDEGGLTYDANGNILSLKRNGVLSGLVKRIDSLTYSYDGNQLTNVTDGTGSQYTDNGFKNLTGSADTATYKYDVNGNLTIDPRKGIVNHYNILNRVDSIRVTAGTNQWISYTYDATGTLLRKRQFNGSSTVPVKVTDYIDGFVYEGGSLVYFATNEGRVRDSANVLTNEYVITDTQGNSRVSFEDNGSGIAKVRQENSYYPFGLVMGNTTTPGSQPNKHLYNAGSEWQNDYGDLPDYYQTFYRNYDASIGRFVGVDPEAESADDWTPYQYALNNPGMLNDPMGDLTVAEFHEVLGKLTNSEYGGHWSSSDASNVYEYGNDQTALLYGTQTFDTNNSWGANPGWANNIVQVQDRYNNNTTVSVSAKFYFSNARYYQTAIWYHDKNGNGITNDRDISSEATIFDFGDPAARRAAYLESNRYDAYLATEKQLSTRRDPGELVLEAAKFYAGGEIGGAILSWALKGAVSLAGRYVLSKAISNPIYKGGEEWAMNNIPRIEALMRGKGIDRAFREIGSDNLILKLFKNINLIEFSPMNKGADIVGKGLLKDSWWDITTPGSWAPHVTKYGPGGTGLFY
ncbi:RHS repeat protein [Mucilaginibacter mali]|uniref:RHS repeat protein n=1 Tax=Mucilaginibacter mali TaxID=2740462 RepID=A0A7D4UNI4_9SPHI|nr:DUF6443 domain-containing protein [Mucilaginibacter mali]QKJ29000.1 RHS repeat protein [Mucilaginibacter mali]